MNKNNPFIIRRFYIIVSALFLFVLVASPAISEEYAALNGVKGLNTVFDFSKGSPQFANIVFWAIRNVHDDKSTRSLSESPQVAVVFHGAAVKLISTDRTGFKDSDNEALDQFAKTIQEMKKNGVTFEVCNYALKVLGVDPATILPEVDHVGNGFISIAGYQARGYSSITIN